MLDAFNGYDDIKPPRREIALEPIGEQEIRIRSVGDLPRVRMLRGRDGDPRDDSANAGCENACGSAVATPHIAHSILGSYRRRVNDEIDQLKNSFLGFLLTGGPEPMVQVFTPKLPVERIDLIVVPCYVCNGRWGSRGNHGNARVRVMTAILTFQITI